MSRRRPGPTLKSGPFGSFEARTGQNWRVITLPHHAGMRDVAIALEPGREHDQVFSGGPDPFWDAVQFAAGCLRGELDPAALP